jgi:hypothetical protein
MERQIADRLAQGNYEKAMDAFIEDFVTYPAAILKGPVYARHKTLEEVGIPCSSALRSGKPAGSWLSIRIRLLSTDFS